MADGVGPPRSSPPVSSVTSQDDERRNTPQIPSSSSSLKGRAPSPWFRTSGRRAGGSDSDSSLPSSSSSHPTKEVVVQTRGDGESVVGMEGVSSFSQQQRTEQQQQQQQQQQQFTGGGHDVMAEDPDDGSFVVEGSGADRVRAPQSLDPSTVIVVETSGRKRGRDEVGGPRDQRLDGDGSNGRGQKKMRKRSNSDHSSSSLESSLDLEESSGEEEDEVVVVRGGRIKDLGVGSGTGRESGEVRGGGGGGGGGANRTILGGSGGVIRGDLIRGGTRGVVSRTESGEGSSSRPSLPRGIESLEPPPPLPSSSSSSSSSVGSTTGGQRVGPAGPVVGGVVGPAGMNGGGGGGGGGGDRQEDDVHENRRPGTANGANQGTRAPGGNVSSSSSSSSSSAPSPANVGSNIVSNVGSNVGSNVSEDGGGGGALGSPSDDLLDEQNWRRSLPISSEGLSQIHDDIGKQARIQSQERRGNSENKFGEKIGLRKDGKKKSTISWMDPQVTNALLQILLQIGYKTENDRYRTVKELYQDILNKLQQMYPNVFESLTTNAIRKRIKVIEETFASFQTHLQKDYEKCGVPDHTEPIPTSSSSLDMSYIQRKQQWDKKREEIYQSCIPTNNPWPYCWSLIRQLFERDTMTTLGGQDSTPTPKSSRSRQFSSLPLSPSLSSSSSRSPPSSLSTPNQSNATLPSSSLPSHIPSPSLESSSSEMGSLVLMVQQMMTTLTSLTVRTNQMARCLENLTSSSSSSRFSSSSLSGHHYDVDGGGEEDDGRTEGIAEGAVSDAAGDGVGGGSLAISFPRLKTGAIRFLKGEISFRGLCEIVIKEEVGLCPEDLDLVVTTFHQQNLVSPFALLNVDLDVVGEILKDARIQTFGSVAVIKGIIGLLKEIASSPFIPGSGGGADLRGSRNTRLSSFGNTNSKLSDNPLSSPHSSQNYPPPTQQQQQQQQQQTLLHHPLHQQQLQHQQTLQHQPLQPPPHQHQLQHQSSHQPPPPQHQQQPQPHQHQHQSPHQHPHQHHQHPLPAAQQHTRPTSHQPTSPSHQQQHQQH